MNQLTNSQLTTPSLDEIISHLNMQKHVEGGFASLFYEDTGYIKTDSLPADFECARPYFNGIYFLVPEGIKTVFHQLPINELWHFCLGAPLQIYEITPQGELKTTILGPDIKNGHQLVHVVSKGNWFGTFSKGEYTLVTCTTSPGFMPQDLKIGKRKVLIDLFPDMKDLIIEFTRENENVHL